MSSFLFLLDTSGSMYGQKIAAVNAALTECMDELRRMELSGTEPVYVGLAVFQEQMEVLTERSTVMAFSPPHMTVEAGSDGFYPLTSYAGLCRGLRELFQEEHYDHLFLITDGRPADAEEYTEELELLKNCSGYRKACRYVVLAGEDPGSLDREMLHFADDQADRVIPLADLSSELYRIGMELQFSEDAEDYEDVFRDG